MISSKEFQREYVNLYEQMRKYIWDISVLEDLAKLEVCIYDSFIDRDKLRVLFSKLKRDVSEIAKEDEELSDALDELGKLVDSNEESYLQLYRVQEAFNNENKED